MRGERRGSLKLNTRSIRSARDFFEFEADYLKGGVSCFEEEEGVGVGT